VIVKLLYLEELHDSSQQALSGDSFAEYSCQERDLRGYSEEFWSVGFAGGRYGDWANSDKRSLAFNQVESRQ
jgi:hypothetical protein